MNTQNNTELVWNIFAEICKIPRGSGNEAQILEYLINWANENKFEYKQDEFGNIIIIKAGAQPAIAMQNHVDMVCEKNNDKVHNFQTDPIETYIKDGWMYANGTTLGSDNGIGMAMAMTALLTYKGDKQLEALFTTEEETGLTGALNLSTDFITAKQLINLDSEEESEICIGCAGGCQTDAEFEIATEKSAVGINFMKICVKGLTGGHSGGEIHLKRANANKILAEFLNLCAEKYSEFRLCSIDGGNLHNAISREAQAIIAIKDKHGVRIDCNIFIAEVEDEWKQYEPNICIDLESCPKQDLCLTADLTKNIIAALVNCPHGVIEMSQELKGTVKTSTNLASIKMRDGIIKIVTSQRSIENKLIKQLSSEVLKKLEPYATKAYSFDGYTSWKPNFNSELLKLAIIKHNNQFGFEPKVKVVHAGLECGIILDKYPELDIISIGPNIQNPHSPFEKVEVNSVNKVYEWLMAIIE